MTRIEHRALKDKARMMVTDFGYAETAQRLNISIWTLYQWAHRMQWSVQPDHPQTVKTVKTEPSQAHAEAMQARKEKSRAYLSKYVLNAAKVASRSRKPLEDAQNVRHVAGVMSATWPEESQGSGKLTLNVLNVAGDMRLGVSE